ncbi:hypothetical protein KBC59_03920 [Patescibacteria group bacterium]|jgi:hypothetical protein|nr:hypothetical protein [Patescibacteria group bacterium]
MQTLQSVFLFVTCSLLALPACREAFPTQTWGYDGTGTGGQDEQPVLDAEESSGSFRAPSVSHLSFDQPSNPTEPQPEESPDSEYATDLYVIAGCNANPEEHLVTDYASMPVCGNVKIIPWQNDDGDTYEVAAPFSWSLDDPVGFGLEFPLGETNNLIRPFVVGPPLTESGQERTTILHACATNDCPTPIPDDCVETLCVDLPLVAVAGIGGTWTFNSSQHDGTPVLISQDGRAFSSEFGTDVEDGFVQDVFVTFESGDYQFDGTLSSDGFSMSGTITELMGMNPAGSWFAVRIE